MVWATQVQPMRPTSDEASAALKMQSPRAHALMQWLPFEKEIFQELYDQDALLVMAKGLGVQRALACFVRIHCSPKSLVLCLNANEQIATLQHLLLTLGLDRKHLPKVIDAKSNSNERMQLYKRGGCFLITSRILVVDLLNNHLDSKVSNALQRSMTHSLGPHSLFMSQMITGMLVNDAHRVTETSMEAFILRLYREKNREGFLKGFTDEAVGLASGFNKMEQVMKHLYVRHTVLYPRFHVGVHSCLDKNQPQVYEIEVAMSPLMRTMQEAILVALEATLKELQRSTKALDASELSMDRALSKAFSVTIRRQLDPLWHKLSAKTKQLVGDLTTLRQLLSYISRYDAISYYSFLLNYQTMNAQQRFPSAWLYTEAADRLLAAAKERLYQVVDTKSKMPLNVRRLLSTSTSGPEKDSIELKLVLEGNPKWQALAEVLDEIQEERDTNKDDATSARTFSGGSAVLVMVKDDRTCAQLREFLSLGERMMMQQRFGHYLLQKESVIKKTGSALGLEQKLLVDAAIKFRANDPSFYETAIAGTTKKGAGKKRAREISTSAAGGFSEASSFGMPMDQLEFFTGQRSAGKSVKSKRVQVSDDFSLPSSSSTPCLSLESVEPQNQVVICTYAQALEQGHGASSLLQDLLPSYVILYDPDMAFIRELEVFHATQKTPLEIYFMMYDESAEQQTYLTEIQKEKRAFEALIHQKANLMLPANVYDVPFHAKVRQNQATEYSMDTRTGGRAQSSRPAGVKVVVDVREFRSALPSMLHKEAMIVLPVTIDVGDYILSPQICVERKSVSDLFGSLNSGRLFNQAENMRRYYQTPVLLIEFTEGRAFSLQDPSEFGSEINASHPISKLTLLVLHYPSLRILWSRSPHATVDLFKVIKKHQDEPDVETAIALGNGQSTEGTTVVSTSTAAYNTNAVDVLKKLPGITEHNFRQVLAKVKNLAELSRMSLDELTAIIGKVCAKKLFTFLNTSI